VRLAVLSFLPLLRERKVLLHEDNQAWVLVLNHLTSRSPAIIDDLRKLLELIDTNNIGNSRTLYSICDQRMGRETDREDWQLNPRIFTYMDSLWGPYSIDSFATHCYTQLPRYNTR
jgi:hypothetical protein